VLHNSLFLVAHFHNVIIGGVLFGLFAGIYYWATVHIIGRSKRIRPRYIVNSQLKIFAPVGIEMI
jgi:heme/copper-type cytochrome/quinol oxidase subunit 1